MSATVAPNNVQARRILIGTALLLTLGMGIRQSFGLFLGPVTQDLANAWSAIAAADGLMYYQDWSTDTMYDTYTGSLQELIGGRSTPEEFVATVQDDWATFQGQ